MTPRRAVQVALWVISCSMGAEEHSCFFQDLQRVAKIDQELKDKLPLFYNSSFIAGYFSMPSARMARSGDAALGAARVSPYNIYGLNFQPFDHLELCANYRVFKGVTEANFGSEGFGDDAERIGNVKFAALLAEDGFPQFPQIAIGLDDFIGTKRFNSQYIVCTQQFLKAGMEATLGWGKGRMKGFFGGAAWTPLRCSGLPLLKDISLLAEYDNLDYKKHLFEHPKGRTVKSRINYGFAFVGWNTVQFSLSTIRGEKIAVSGSLRYPIGTSKGLFPKVEDPLTYYSPVDTEPLGVIRSEHLFAQQIAHAFAQQGVDLYQVYLIHNPVEVAQLALENEKTLYLKIINNRYWNERAFRDRLEHLLAALTPHNITYVTAAIEADGVISEQYNYRLQDLRRYHEGAMGREELEILSPMANTTPFRHIEDSALLFQRKKPIWTFTIRPRLLNYFGSSQGKYKYNFGLLASPEGYLFDQLYYKLQVGYQIHSSTQTMNSVDRLNPSRLPNVRTDSILYLQSNTWSLEQAFVQKSWNFGKGWFYRIAGGYFEPAYGGLATETLYYPANSVWAVGVEGAVVPKRRYHGIAFTDKIREFKEGQSRHIPFIGLQYFLDAYYYFKPLEMSFKLSVGQFLARDKGFRIDVGRYFQSGLKLSLWLAVTNGNDHINGKIYYDKGFAFSLPLDLFLRQSSRNFIGYGMAAWLRDVGAQADTGKPLYQTLSTERLRS